MKRTIASSASARGDPGELERGERGGGVLPVVLAGHGERELDRLELPAADDVRNAVEPIFEERAQLGLGCVGGVVVELDVREDGDLRSQGADRAVGLVALDDEPAGAGAGVAPELRHDTADDPRRVAAGLVQDERDHRRGRRLPVGAADDDRRLRGDELGEEVGARDAVDPVPVRGRDDDLPAVGRRRLAAEVDLDPLERAEEDRVPGLPAAHLGAEGAGHVRVGGEAGAADADEVEAATGEAPALSVGQARSPPRRSGPPRRRAPSPASPRASSEALRVGEQLSHERRHRSTSAFGTTIAPPPRSKCRALSVWWSAVA